MLIQRLFSKIVIIFILIGMTANVAYAQIGIGEFLGSETILIDGQDFTIEFYVKCGDDVPSGTFQFFFRYINTDGTGAVEVDPVIDALPSGPGGFSRLECSGWGYLHSIRSKFGCQSNR